MANFLFTMKALHLSHKPSDRSTRPFTFQSSPATPSDLILSNHYTRPVFPIQPGNNINGASGEDSPTNTNYSTEWEDSDSPHQYLISVITTSFVRGELAWRETLLPERFANNRAPIPCHDVVGRITAIRSQSPFQPFGATGKINRAAWSVPGFKIGDVVYGVTDLSRDGAAASLVVAFGNELCKVPPAPSATPIVGHWYETLATIPLAGLTAWQALFEHGKLQEPELEFQNQLIRDLYDSPPEKEHSYVKILVTGADRGVGLLAIELAAAARSKSQDVFVTALCSSRNVLIVRNAGADVVESHELGTKNIGEAIQRLAPFDLFVDLTGPPLLPAILSMHNGPMRAAPRRRNSRGPPLIKPDGKIVSTATIWSEDLEAAVELDNVRDSKLWLKRRFKHFSVKPNGVQLQKISKMLTRGSIRGSILTAGVYPLERWKDAMEVIDKESSEVTHAVFWVDQEKAS